ncbi:MAG: TonB-dependent receptor [Vicinamibacteraceae bacterium]
MRFTIPCALLLLTVLAGDAAPVRAQTPPAEPPGGLADKSLEDLMSVEVGTVFGAAKREQRVTEAPSSVTIVTAEDIRLFGWRTLAEALTSVRGFYVTNDRNYSYVGVRGFSRPTDYNNRILILVNGHRFNDNVYDQALVGFEFPIDMALVDRIEVIRGPGSALYGTSAFFAVINVVLRPGGGVGGSESSIELGTFDTYRVRTSYGQRSKSGVDSLFSISHLGSSGQEALYFPEFDEPAFNSGVNRNADDESATSLFGSLGRGRFTLQGAYVHRRKLIPTGSYGTTFDNRNYTEDDRGWVDGMVTGAFKGAALTGRAFADITRYRGRYVFLDGGSTDDSGDGAWIGVEGTASRRVGERQHITTGLEYRRNLLQDQKFLYLDPVEVTVDSQYQSNQVAVYAQDEITLHRRLTATVGARYDWWSLTGGTATPRAGLVYRTDADTAFKALYGEAYRAPSVYETYYYPDPDQRVLQPERLRTSEVVYEQYVGGTLRLTATGYITNARNLISQRADYIFENREQARSHGVELEAERRWTSGLLVRGSFVAQQTRDPLADVELSNSPRRLAVVQASLPLWQRRVAIAAESQYVGRRFSTLGTPIDGVWLTNVNVNMTPSRRAFSLAARVSNLFDTAYAHPVGVEFRQDLIPQDGRSVSLRATLRF